MATKDLYRFDDLAESCGNRYLAVRFIANWARKLGEQYSGYYLIESRLIQWVVTGKCPYIEAELESRKIKTDDDRVEDFLSLVSDNEVFQEVISLYKQSIRSRHLLYCQNTSLSEGRRSRANVLLRMVWYSKHIGG